MRTEKVRKCGFLAKYQDKKNPDATHYEWRNYDFVRMTDNRMSDYMFEDAVYPVTDITGIGSVVLPYEVQRARKGTGWKVVSRRTGRVYGSFDTFDDGYEYAKTLR